MAIDSGKIRNEKCPCGSGLKVKNCHGDMALKRDVSNIANGLLVLFLAQRRIAKKLVEPDEATALIDKVTGEIDAMLPECVRLETNYEVKEEVPPPPDKLEEKEKSGSCLNDLQQDMVMCKGCGRRLPAGMNCEKCKKGKSKS